MVADDLAVCGAGKSHDGAGTLGGIQTNAERRGDGHARKVVDDAITDDGIVGAVHLIHTKLEPFIVVGKNNFAELYLLGILNANHFIWIFVVFRIFHKKMDTFQTFYSKM